ncbi:MAG: GtrA family protein [Deltaproteobacteria bacterium]|nr:GtrA family protein [Deltaproteobacteria bacterium]
MRKVFKQIIGFGASGIIGTVCNLMVTIILHEIFSIEVRGAYLFGLLTAVLVNFYLCRNLIFQSKGNMWRQLFAYVLSSFLFRGLEYGAFLLQEMTINLPYVLAILLIQATSFLLKFFYYRELVFTRIR